MQTLDAKVQDFLAQKRIAVAGVSRDNSRHPVGNLIFHRLKTTGHDVFPINPHMQTFEGERCYPDVQSIPDGVDGVVVITRPDATEQIVRDCGKVGVSRVWMHQSFGAGATSVSPSAVEYCREHGISVIAGACPMMYGPGADFGHTCMRWILGITGQLPKCEEHAMNSTMTLHRPLAAEPAFAGLRGHSFMELTTYRKTGKPVATRVWFAEAGGRLYITTAKASGKIKRLRHTACVQLVPCGALGAVQGPAIDAVAHVLPERQHARALAALRRKYGWLFWVFERCSRGSDQTYLEVTHSSATVT